VQTLNGFPADNLFITQGPENVCGDIFPELKEAGGGERLENIIF
jgi:hypothetical protein